MRSRAPPVPLLPCWGYSHPPGFSVWLLRIRTQSSRLSSRAFTDISPAPPAPRPALSHRFWKATLLFIYSQLFHKMLERTMKTMSSFLPKASFTFECKTTDSLRSRGGVAGKFTRCLYVSGSGATGQEWA